MRYFRYEMPGPEIHLFPLVCWHIGAKQSSIAFISEVIRQIKEDPLARWLYMGDAGECVIKTSKGNIYEQLLNPGDQLRVAAGLLAPIKDKGLFGIRGNHGNRVDKDSGLGWDETLCARIGIPYLGVSCLGNIILRYTKTSRLNFSLFAHHGSASAVTPAGKMGAGHKAEQLVAADIICTAHTHACGTCWPFKHFAQADGRERRIRWHTIHAYVCGSAYDSRSGYAEEKMYTPMMPEHMVITAKVESGVKSGTVELAITHRTIEGFADRFANQDELAKWRGEEESPLRLIDLPEAA
jgi:hypothetical protein